MASVAHPRIGRPGGRVGTGTGQQGTEVSLIGIAIIGLGPVDKAERYSLTRQALRGDKIAVASCEPSSER